MTFESILLSLYLLFPSFNPMQDQLIYALKNDSYVFQDVTYSRNQLARLYAQYFPDSENEPFFPEIQGEADSYNEDYQKWVLKELENPAFESMSEGLSFIAGLTENGKAVSEKILLNSLMHLRQFEYGSENLSLNKLPDSSTQIVSVNDDIITLTQYDDNYNLTEKTIWKNSDKSTSEMNMISRASYLYKLVENKWELESVNEESFLGNVQTETVYDKNLNPVIINKYQVNSSGKKLLKTINRSYNSDRQITSEETVEYGSRISRKKNVYKYTDKADLPDYEFYEDNVLRIKDVYESNEVYTETIYFDDEYRVVCRYEKNKKVLEQFFAGDLELKRSSPNE